MPVYYIFNYFQKPYIGGYYCTNQERFKQRYVILRKYLKYLIDNFYKNENNAVINILALLSSIRLASSFDANPPNTTECSTPILPHANIAITASGTIGM